MSTRRRSRRARDNGLRRSLLVIATLLIVVEMVAYGHVSMREKTSAADEIVAAQGQFARLADGTIRRDGRCLTGPAEASSAKTPLTLQTCDGGPTQQWRPLGDQALLNRTSGLCLNTLPNNDSPFAYPCGGMQAHTSASAAASAPGPTSRVGPAPAPGPSSAAQLRSDLSGAAMPRGDLPGWRQVFTDDFTTNVPLGSFPDAVSSNWEGYDGSRDTSKNGLYSPGQVVSISNGIMNLHLHTAGGTALVAAPIPRIPGASSDGGMLYGRYAVRFRADPVPGYKTAWLLWPDSDNWSDGEIDFPEGSLNSDIFGYAHHVGSPSESTAYDANARYTTWHTAVIEWTPSYINFIMDGKVIGHETDKSHIPSTAMHWVLQTETDLDGGAPSSSAQGNVQIDWVAVWARN